LRVAVKVRSMAVAEAGAAVKGVMAHWLFSRFGAKAVRVSSVSYTHLTLPTILRV